MTILKVSGPYSRWEGGEVGVYRNEDFNLLTRKSTFHKDNKVV